MFRLVVLSAALAVASASPSGILGGLAVPWNTGIVSPLAAPIASSLLAAPLASPLVAAPLAAVGPIGAYNYRGPLSLAPGQPANILAADGRPLDTLSVNLDRAAHITAKAIEGSGHLLKKRSIGAPILAAPVAAGPLVASPLVGARVIGAPLSAAPLVASPLAASNLAAAQLAGAGLIAGPLAAPAVALSSPLGLASPVATLGLGINGLGQLW